MNVRLIINAKPTGRNRCEPTGSQGQVFGLELTVNVLGPRPLWREKRGGFGPQVAASKVMGNGTGPSTVKNTLATSSSTMHTVPTMQIVTVETDSFDN